MNRFDRFVFTALIGSVAPVFFFLAFWWSTVKVVPEKYIFLFASLGLLLGLMMDFLFLKKIMSGLFKLNILILIFVFLFYSVCIYGFFMGMPLFNLIMGAFAGRYLALRTNYKKESASRAKKYMICCASFSSVVLVLFGAASAYLALNHASTPSELKNMLGLHFEITRTIVWIIILAGGILMTAFEYFLTLIIFKKSVNVI